LALSMMYSLFILFFLLPVTLSKTFPFVFPTCLEENKSWDAAGIMDIIPGVESAEECQKLCQSDVSCLGVTWTSDQFPLHPLSCTLYSEISSEISCENCISGPSKCSCILPGECKIEDHNVVGIFSDVDTMKECSSLCDAEDTCAFYTFMGDTNVLGTVCILYNSCKDFVTNCSDCHTGAQECYICKLEFSNSDGSCSAVELYADQQYAYFKAIVPDGITLTEGKVHETCQLYNMEAVCYGDASCSYTDTSRCVVTKISTDCGSPPRRLSAVLCNESDPTNCPQLQGLFNFLNDWYGGECGIVGSTWCVKGKDYTSTTSPLLRTLCPSC